MISGSYSQTAEELIMMRSKYWVGWSMEQMMMIAQSSGRAEESGGSDSAHGETNKRNR